jgi:putative ABC transport system ATP-binding protein
MHTANPFIVVDTVTRSWPTPAGPFNALTDVSLTIGHQEFVVVSGQSGSGKSTLLALLAGIDRPTSGKIFIGQTAVHALAERDLSLWRGTAVGIVFQFFQLLPTLTVVENVMLPMDFTRRWPARERRERAMALLVQLGIAEQANKLPSRLSGGQQQRVAVARALANDPRVLLADEPTGNLDSRTAGEMLEMLASLVDDGRTVVMATHDAAARRIATRTITIADGCIQDA